MSLSPQTKDQLTTYLRSVTLKYLKDAPVDLSKPYHETLLPWLTFAPVSEHSFATRSGAWFANMAQIVARQYHPTVQQQYRLHGRIRINARAEIDEIMASFNRRTDRQRPDRARDLARVLERQGEGGQDEDWISDFYVCREDESEMFFELKTPQPNKAHCQTIKRGILTIAAMKKGFRAEAWGGFAYNPYNKTGASSPYSWNYARQFLEIGQDVLIGRAFWAKIGEPTTFDEVFAVARGVGLAMEHEGKAILDARLSRP
jgi:Type II restriction endonuclease, TdeIII